MLLMEEGGSSLITWPWKSPQSDGLSGLYMYNRYSPPSIPGRMDSLGCHPLATCIQAGAAQHYAVH